MRLLDSLYGLPYLPFAAIVVILFQVVFPSVSPIVYVTVALSFLSWFTAARLMRGQVLVAKEEVYVDSAEAAGASSSSVSLASSSAVDVPSVAITLPVSR